MNLKLIFRNLGIILMFMTTLSCKKLEEIIPQKENASIKNYTIKKGGHHSTHSIAKLETNQLKFKARFDSSAIYTTADKENQADINKLYGFSDCSSSHHTNSARFGWRWTGEDLEIHAYTYVNGERNSKYITSVAFDKAFDYSLTAHPDQYQFTVKDVTIFMERSCAGPASGYVLYPYFGGDETAPHDINILIEIL